MTEYIENPFSGKLRGVTYEDGKIIDVHIRDTDDVVKVFVPVRHGRWKAYWDDIEAAPTVDAVEVVRCRDCKFRSSWMMNRNLRYICPESGMFPNCENDFCSYGKWKGGKDHA